tara:strand:- start:6377 stop:7522 length:1146 start_codon:yes stop_codon:yes gene_type:complete
MYQNTTKKVIEINPELFTLNKSAKHKKDKKIKPKIPLQSNQIKRELMKKIKHYQSKSQDKINKDEKNRILEKADKSNNTNNTNNSNDEIIFDNEFNNSLNFLQELSKDKYQEKIKKQTLKQKKKERKNESFNINLEIPKEFEVDNNELLDDNNNELFSDNTNNNTELLSDNNKLLNNNNELLNSNNNTNDKSLPYGCLKGGFKPTFREWKRLTQKKPLEFNENKLEFNEEPLEFNEEPLEFNENKLENLTLESKPDLSIRQEKLHNLKENYLKKDDNILFEKKVVPVIDRKIKTTKYRLGKHGKKISILIKNNDTRKNIKEDLSKLKKKSIIDIKNYLRKHNLIKIGSNAPNDVLRQIYEQSILAGNVNNKNNNNFLHNNL